MADKCVLRVDPKNGRIFVRDSNGTENSFGAVSVINAEFGAGMIRGEVVETFSAPVGGVRHMDRAYFNPNKVQRYVDSKTGRVISDARGALLTGNSVFYTV